MSYHLKGNEAFFVYCHGPKGISKSCNLHLFFSYFTHKVILPQTLLTCMSWLCSAHHQGSQRPWLNSNGEVLKCWVLLEGNKSHELAFLHCQTPFYAFSSLSLLSGMVRIIILTAVTSYALILM